MNYGDLIKDAFWITWRNRFLWFFGFFAGSSSFNFNFPTGSGNFDGGDPGESSFGATLLSPEGQVGLLQAPFDNVALLAGLVVVGLLIFLVFLVLSLISQGGLAESVAAIDRGEGRRFSSTWRAGVSNFWRVLGYYVLFILISLGLFLAVAIPSGLAIFGILAATDSLGLRILLIGLVALVVIAALILIFIPLLIIMQFALRELVVRGERIVRSIGGGYRVFRRNPGRSFLVWLIQLGLMLGAGIALLLAAFLVGLVLFLPTIALAIAEYTTAAIATGIVAGLILLPLFLIASGALGAFNHAYWTLAYLRITGLVSPQD